MKIKMTKKTIKIVAIAVGALLVVGGYALTLSYMKRQFTEYEVALSTRDGQLEQFQQKIEEIGPLTTCYELNYDVKGGTVISESDFTSIEIPQKAAAGYVQDINEVIGKYYKTDIAANTVMPECLAMDFVLENDLRYLDVVIDELPIGLEVGDYVDVRFRFTFGQDMIALAHKQIVDINLNVLKLVVDEKDIYTYESMQKDKAQYVGCKTSAIQYIEGAIQPSGKNYYPLRIDILATLVQDPNIKDAEDLSQFQLINRELLEDQLISQSDLSVGGGTLEDQIKKIYASSIQSGEAQLNAAYNAALEYYNEVKSEAALNGSYTGSVTENFDFTMP